MIERCQWQLGVVQLLTRLMDIAIRLKTNIALELLTVVKDIDSNTFKSCQGVRRKGSLGTERQHGNWRRCRECSCLFWQILSIYVVNRPIFVIFVMRART